VRTAESQPQLASSDVSVRAVAGLVAVAILLMAVHLWRPTGPVGDVTYLAAVTGGAVMGWVGALRRPRGSSRIPVLIAVGITLSALGDLIWMAYVWSGREPNVSVADAFYSVAYVGLIAALVLAAVVRAGSGARIDPDSVLDALTIIVVSVLIFWDISIAAIVADTTVSGATRVVWAAYPVLDAILLALVVRVLLDRRSRASIGIWFAGGVACWLVADLGYVVSTSAQVGAFLDTGWMLGAILMATSAWRRPDQPELVGTEDAGSAHPLWLLGIATLPIMVPLVLHFLGELRDEHPSVLPVLIGVALLLGLGFVRSARLLQSEGRARTEARASRDAALEASRAKSAFLATMSHEIRTPMNGVIGLTGLLQHTELDERQRQYVDGVHLAGEALLRIINDILDFSKIEAGKLELDIIDFSLVQVVEEAAELVAESARNKGLELLAYCSPELPLDLRGDPSRLRQVLLNLATNAVKFTDTGEVVLRARLEGETADGLVVLFEITDTGVGLETIDRQRLFDPFSQADSSTTRRFGGTGLGLAICQQLVTAMGGELGVDSEIGQGSTFWFTLPLQLAEADTTTASVRSTVELTGLRALVVDDNETNRLILRGQLTAWGMRPDVANDGHSALAMLEEAATSETPYAMALLDLCMPGMDGMELAKRISDSASLAGVELLLLTSVPDVSAEEALAHGVSVRLTKPVQLSRLHSAIQDLSRGSRRSRNRPVSAKAPAPGGRGHVLVVEDNHVNQLVAVGILEHLGYSTEVAGNGLEALTSWSRTVFGAVLMDCQMPEMDGYDATREIRRLEGDGPRTPVIAMTAGVTEGERERCLLAGMDDYVSKPVSPSELDATLTRWLPALLT
jgi:two-component system sensor histidine kinase/response regulator